MKILMTGSTGFVGQAVLKQMIASGHQNDVVLLSSKQNDSLPTCVYHFDGERYSWELTQDIHTLVHIGAWIPKSVNESQNIDKGFGNITFTRSLLQSLPNLKRLVFISTIDVYAPTKASISEDSLVKPISIYGYSKLYCEEMVKAWTAQKGVACCILRLGHIYGVGEVAYQKLIPMLIQQAIRNETITIFSAGDELRSFLYIDDCASVICQAALGQMQGLYNVASEHAVSVKEITYTIKQLTNSESDIVIQNQPIETRDMVFNITLLKKNFMMREKSLEQGLVEEIKYFKSLPA